MLKILLKKQLYEVFRSYFYDAKKNKMRTKVGIAAWIVFFVVIMVGVLGGMFTYFALTLGDGLVKAGIGWLYFVLLCVVAIVLGAFGSVFNTYAGLYLGKDNDLLLSLPIPVRTIMAARLANVYLMGTMYAATVMIPTLIVYWVLSGVTAAKIICGILLFLIVTTIVLLLSCLLGWVVARISLRLKNKSFFTVLASLAFIGLYYFFYFRANIFIQNIIRNAVIYGEKVKGKAYLVYLFGRIGEGDWLAALIYTLVTAALFAVVWTLMTRSFLRIATSRGTISKVRYTEKAVREKSVFSALLGKEFGRFTASANYMLNCGLGILILPVSGIVLLIKGREICETLGEVFSARQGTVEILFCTALIMLASMTDMAAPSVSLEGKSIWICQSLPISAKSVLRAKAAMQLILSGIPMLFAAICVAVVLQASLPVKILVCLLAMTYTAFYAVANTAIGVRMPLLNWTNEIAPIKQSGAVTIALFGGWAICAAFAGLYLLIGYKIGAVTYLILWTILFAAAGLLLLRWMDTKGAEAFSAL